jgi:hypothetical protein
MGGKVVLVEGDNEVVIRELLLGQKTTEKTAGQQKKKAGILAPYNDSRSDPIAMIIHDGPPCGSTSKRVLLKESGSPSEVP